MTDAFDRGARSGRRVRETARASADPFAALGLPARPGLSDEDVRAAWRRIAAATHPDREDGGDPRTFGAAAAAYAELRTDFGRAEALADLGLSGPSDHRGRPAGNRRRQAGSVVPAGRHRARRAVTGPALPRLLGQLAGLGQFPGLGPLRTAIASGTITRPRGRPGGLAVRAAVAAGAAVAAVAIAGWSPGVVGVLAGLLTWLVAGARRALGRRSR